MAFTHAGWGRLFRSVYIMISTSEEAGGGRVSQNPFEAPEHACSVLGWMWGPHHLTPSAQETFLSVRGARNEPR